MKKVPAWVWVLLLLLGVGLVVLVIVLLRKPAIPATSANSSANSSSSGGLLSELEQAAETIGPAAALLALV